MPRLDLLILASSHRQGSRWYNENFAKRGAGLVLTIDNYYQMLQGVTIDDKTTVVKLYGWEEGFWKWQGGSHKYEECMELIKLRSGNKWPIIYDDTKGLRSSDYTSVTDTGDQAGNESEQSNHVSISADPWIGNTNPDWYGVGKTNGVNPWLSIKYDQLIAERVRSAKLGSYIHINGV